MSDSDSDDLYSDNYTSKRVAAHAKRKQKELNSLSSFINNSSNDEAEDVEEVSREVNKKRKIVNISDDEDDCSTSTKYRTHDEYIEELSKQKAAESCRMMKKKAEQEIANEKFATSMRPKLQTEIGQFNRVKKIFEELDAAEKINDLKVIDNDDLENESFSSSLPVTIDVMDLEIIRNGIFKVDILLDENFESVRLKLAEKWGIDISDVSLTHKGKLVEPSDTPKKLGFVVLQIPHPVFEASKKFVPIIQSNNQVIQIDDFDEVREVGEKTNSEISIKFQMGDRKKPIEIYVNGSATIDDLKNLLYKQLGDDVDKSRVRLMFDDEYLTNGSKTIDDIGIEDGDCIDVY